MPPARYTGPFASLSVLLLLCIAEAAADIVIPAGQLEGAWGDLCRPEQFQLGKAADIPESQCGEAQHSYTICDGNARKQMPDEMDICSCAQACVADKTCSVMSYQEDRDHPERSQGKWANTRCFLYSTCTKATTYTPNSKSQRWCMAIGKVAVAACSPNCVPEDGFGFILATILLLVGAGYVGIGVAVGQRQRSGRPLSMQAHPHYLHWLELRALVTDGLAFAAGRRASSRETPPLLSSPGSSRPGGARRSHASVSSGKSAKSGGKSGDKSGKSRGGKSGKSSKSSTTGKKGSKKGGKRASETDNKHEKPTSEVVATPPSVPPPQVDLGRQQTDVKDAYGRALRI